ncbi:MAG: GntR family transcriptional regulator [Pseudomonadota bacterium]
MSTTAPSTVSHSLIPLHRQVREFLLREIAAGHFCNGDRLPPEAELARTLRVAVGTLRRALAQLEKEGLIIRRQGSGTYVHMPAESIYSFFRLEALSGGGLPTALIIRLDRIPKPITLPSLGDEVAPCPDVFRIRRLRSLNGQPCALEEIWLDGRHTESLDPAQIGDSLYAHYREALGFWITRVEDHIGVAVPPRWIPPEFQVDPSAPCGYIEREAWGSTGFREEFSTTWYNPRVARYCARWMA